MGILRPDFRKLFLSCLPFFIFVDLLLFPLPMRSLKTSNERVL